MQHATLLPLLLLLSYVRGGQGFSSPPHSIVGARKSRSSMSGKRSELGASPRKTDSRSVLQWLNLSPREVERLRKPFGRSFSALLEERLALEADGRSDSVAVREREKRALPRCKHEALCTESGLRHLGWGDFPPSLPLSLHPSSALMICIPPTASNSIGLTPKQNFFANYDRVFSVWTFELPRLTRDPSCHGIRSFSSCPGNRPWIDVLGW